MKRFEYRKMTAQEFRDGLNEIGMGYLAFSRIFGQDERRVRKWMGGDEDIPNWLPPVLGLLRANAGNISTARAVAADYITRDNEHPERGDYPFRRFED